MSSLFTPHAEHIAATAAIYILGAILLAWAITTGIRKLHDWADLNVARHVDAALAEPWPWCADVPDLDPTPIYTATIEHVVKFEAQALTDDGLWRWIS